MEILSATLPIVIDILLVVLLTVGIILIIKCIYIIDKAKNVINNVEEKVNSLNSLFGFINLLNSRFAVLTDKIVDAIENFVYKIINRKKDKTDEVVDIKIKKGKD